MPKRAEKETEEPARQIAAGFRWGLNDSTDADIEFVEQKCRDNPVLGRALASMLRRNAVALPANSFQHELGLSFCVSIEGQPGCRCHGCVCIQLCLLHGHRLRDRVMYKN